MGKKTGAMQDKQKRQAKLESLEQEHRQFTQGHSVRH
jgi:hypothetical protein